MSWSKLVPLITVIALGYTQRNHIKKIGVVPINAVKVEATRYELNVIRRVVRLDAIADKLPSNLERAFTRYLRTRLHSSSRDVTRDFWGKPYCVQSYQDAYQFWSYGPDRTNETKDDVWVDLPKSF